LNSPGIFQKILYVPSYKFNILEKKKKNHKLIYKQPGKLIVDEILGFVGQSPNTLENFMVGFCV